MKNHMSNLDLGTNELISMLQTNRKITYIWKNPNQLINPAAILQFRTSIW